MNTTPSQRWHKITNMLFEKQDGASLAVFRILLGLLLMKSVPEFADRYIVHDFKPTYYGFDWIYANESAVEICLFFLPYTVFCIALGLFYRLAMPLTALMIGYLFLAFPEYYLNHYYLLLLYLTLMSFMPANRTWAIDALLQKKNATHPKQSVPRWCYLVLKLQTEIMLVFAGLVKINNDWLHLLPLTGWIQIALHDTPYIGWVFLYDTTIAIGAYGIIILHVLGAPLLFWSRTRFWIFSIYVCFHLTNSVVFHIGIFPYMTIAATLLFFNPDWPRKFENKLKPYVPTYISALCKTRKYAIWQRPKARTRTIITTLISLWLIVQILIPLPPLFTPNIETEWSGHRAKFTWRMMLNERAIKSVVFAVHMPEKHRIEFISLKEYLSERQCRRIAWSDITVQFARHLKEIYSKEYNTDTVKIHAYIVLRINLRETEIWANPTLDLAQYKPIFGIHEWLEPVDNPLRTWREYLKAHKYIAPTYGEVLTAMNIPAEETIIFENAGMSMDTRVPKLTCN